MREEGRNKESLRHKIKLGRSKHVYENRCQTVEQEYWIVIVRPEIRERLRKERLFNYIHIFLQSSQSS